MVENFWSLSLSSSSRPIEGIMGSMYSFHSDQSFFALNRLTCVPQVSSKAISTHKNLYTLDLSNQFHSLWQFKPSHVFQTFLRLISMRSLLTQPSVLSKLPLFYSTQSQKLTLFSLIEHRKKNLFLINEVWISVTDTRGVPSCTVQRPRSHGPFLSFLHHFPAIHRFLFLPHTE